MLLLLLFFGGCSIFLLEVIFLVEGTHGKSIKWATILTLIISHKHMPSNFFVPISGTNNLDRIIVKTYVIFFNSHFISLFIVFVFSRFLIFHSFFIIFYFNFASFCFVISYFFSWFFFSLPFSADLCFLLFFTVSLASFCYPVKSVIFSSNIKYFLLTFNIFFLLEWSFYEQSTIYAGSGKQNLKNCGKLFRFLFSEKLKV